MGRGSGEQRSLAQQQLDSQNAFIASQRQEREQGRKMLMPQISDLLNSQGYDEPTKTAMTGAAMESNDAAFNAGGQQIENRAAATNNSAGVSANLSDLARQRAMAKSDTSRGLQTQFAQEKYRRQSAGRQLLASTYGIDTNLLGNIAGLPNASLNNYAQGISHLGINTPVGGFSV